MQVKKFNYFYFKKNKINLNFLELHIFSFKAIIHVTRIVQSACTITSQIILANNAILLAKYALEGHHLSVHLVTMDII